MKELRRVILLLEQLFFMQSQFLKCSSKVCVIAAFSFAFLLALHLDLHLIVMSCSLSRDNTHENVLEGIKAVFTVYSVTKCLLHSRNQPRERLYAKLALNCSAIEARKEAVNTSN